MTYRWLLQLGVSVWAVAISRAELPLERDASPPARPPVTRITGETNTRVVRLTVTLADGSRIVGTPTVMQLPAATALGDVSIPLEKIQSIQWASADAPSMWRLKNGDQLQGTLKLATLILDTSFGRVGLPVKTITGIAVTLGGDAAGGDADLVFHYTFEVDNENVELHDVRTVAQDGLGRVGVFGGGGSYAAVLKRGSFEFGPHDQFTVAAWVKIQGRQGTQAIVVKAPTELPPEGGWEWGIILEDSNRFASGWERHHILHSATVPKMNAWYHVAVTYADGNWKMYVNGKPEDETSEEFITARRGMVAIGRKGEQRAYADWFQGQIGDVRIYKHALTSQQIAALQQPSP